MTNSTETLMNNYEKLHPFRKKILQVLSVAYVNANQTQLLDCFKVLNIKAKTGEDFNLISRNDGYKLIREHLDFLLENTFLQGLNRSNLMVNRQIVELITRKFVMEEKQFPTMASSILTTLGIEGDLFRNNRIKYRDIGYLISIMRVPFYQKKIDQAISLYRKYIFCFSSFSKHLAGVFTTICTPFDPEWFQLLPANIHTEYFINDINHDLFYWTDITSNEQYLENLVISGSDKCEVELEAVVLEKWMLTGKQNLIDKWQKDFGKIKFENSLCLQGWINFCNGNNQEAIVCYEQSLELCNKRSPSRKKVFFDNFMGIFYITALIKDGRYESLIHAKKLCLMSTSLLKFENIYSILNNLLEFLTGNSSGADSILNWTTYNEKDWEQNFKHVVGLYHSYNKTALTEQFFAMFAHYWVSKSKTKDILNSIKTLHRTAKKNSYSWFSKELESLIDDLKTSKTQIKNNQNRSSLISVVENIEVWEHTLNALLSLNKPREAGADLYGKEDSDKRMAWILHYEENGSCDISPKEQKKTKKGLWSKGRPIALKRLYDDLEWFEYLTHQDKKICKHIFPEEYRDGWYTKTEYIFDENFIPDLIGHPNLFLADKNVPVDLIEGKPELVVSKLGNSKLKLTLIPEPQQHFDEEYMLVTDTPTRIKAFTLDSNYYEIAKILGEGVTVPVSVKDKIGEIIGNLASNITINSDVEGGGNLISEIKADTKIYIQLSPLGAGLKLSMAMRPFGKTGPSYLPGKGGKNVIATIDNSQKKTTRNLKKERAQTDALINSCPTLQMAENDNGDWLFPEIEDSLELIHELDLQKSDAIIEWPEGKSFRLVGTASINQFRVNIKKEEDWFSMKGKVKIDEQITLDMMELLKNTQNSFVEIKKGQFVKLTKEFNKRLQQLNRYSENQDDSIRFHPLAALALEGFIKEVPKVRTDKAWKSHIGKLQNVTSKQLPIPSTLNVSLRDYQIEGVNWMTCLSEWGVGACLADDMGLGKTLQAVAILIRHAVNGSSLVIAPTSVCTNWIAEIEKFAPTLNLISLGNSNRKETLNSLKNFDVVICSYGLIQQKKMADMLSDVSWQMVILDEAQAIKNFTTKRSKAVMKLKAVFKTILTGTPIENHLGELWNLFQFINPGLLGSLEWFNQKFAVPIERDNDNQARKDLKKLIQPFILRRIKSQVLDELPARTEIRMDIDLSDEEMAFYEALRRQAVKRLDEDDETHGGKKHLKILAEITKLRQACCNSELVNKKISIPSSKLTVFSEILEELLQNKHKALVFSQFVGHLTIIRKYLDKMSINYQYLDGSTPTAKRKKAINAFQSGDGDVFLISLKAGGLGLNLTAADYVIHLDPWWNPAVEDQASDRAHRIGQKRPVTIYRLVTKGTIEEKIVKMHKHKRNLADSLLKGSDISGKMTAKDLLKLIQE